MTAANLLFAMLGFFAGHFVTVVILAFFHAAARGDTPDNLADEMMGDWPHDPGAAK